MKSVLVVVPTTYVWPAHIIPWADYKGATKSHLSSGQVTEIIVSLLVAAGIDHVTHVRVQHDAEVEDHQPDENHNNKVEIEEHFVEVQEGPLLDENYGDNENSLYNQLNMAEQCLCEVSNKYK